MLGIEIKLLTVFYSQIDGQTEEMNYESEQYLRFFINHRQKDWLEQLVSAEFTVNNTYSATKISLFMANYCRELRMRIDVRCKRRMKKITEFVERMKKIQEEVGAALKKAQKKMKQQVDRGKKKAKLWKVENKCCSNHQSKTNNNTSNKS